MKLSLSPQVIESIANIQKNPILIGMIEDAENFILDCVDCNIGDETMEIKLSKGIVNHVKGLREVRKLIEKICIENE